jgi:hypothetical protein
LTMTSICPKTTPKFQECILPIRSQDECLADAKIPGAAIDYAEIPGVTDAKIPGVVDGDAEHAPESVEIQDLANTAREAEPVAPAPIAQQAEPQGGRSHKRLSP